MSEKGKNRLGATKATGGTRQGSNPARVAAMQQLLRSGAYGTHKQATDKTRGETKQSAIADSQD